MEIILLRHGRPDVPGFGKLRLSELPQWIESYNAAGLAASSRPPKPAIKVATCSNAIVCSELPRSIASAEALSTRPVDFISPIFREVDLPYAPFPSPRLKPQVWAFIFRTLWLAGYSANGESLAKARQRAFNGAEALTEIAEKRGSVLLVGHGFTNRFIARELRSRGWHGPANPGRQYWEFGIYRMI